MNPPALSFQEHDKLNLATFAKQFEKFLTVEHHFSDDALVVSLNAPFGSGKTHFLEMWRHDLEQRREKDPQLPLPIYINAWESDYCGDPLVAILSEFIDELDKLPKTDDGDATKTKPRLRSALAFLGNIGNQLLEKATGVDAAEALGRAKEKLNPEKAGQELLDSFKAKSTALEALKTELRTLFSGMEPKAIIMVDELDRCRPDFAIHYLETIKHIFSTKGLIFVLAVDHGQLAATARALFGQDLNFPEYYRKFASRQVSLPEMDENACANYCRSLEKKFIATPEGTDFVRASGFTRGTAGIKNIQELTSALKLKPRQLKEVYRVIGHAAAISNSQQPELPWTWADGLMLMAALKIAGHQLYQLLLSQTPSREEVFREMNMLMANPRAKIYWINLLMIGTFTEKDTAESTASEIWQLYEKYVKRKPEAELSTYRDHLKSLQKEWELGSVSTQRSCLSDIGQIIETAQQFYGN